jgi:ABC-type dipeptide/oligopeptide/nickel transport system ATPase component
MILKSARITSFRSIEDSGEFSIDPVTCLVGENGAGKSAILEALYKLNPVEAKDGTFSTFDYPRKKYSEYRTQHATRPATVVTTAWELDADDAELLKPLIGSPAVESLRILVSKGYDNQRRWVVEVDEAAVVQHLIGAAKLRQHELQPIAGATTVRHLISLLESLHSRFEGQESLLRHLLEHFADGNLQAAIVNRLTDRLPKFVYVTEYASVPGEVALDQLKAPARNGHGSHVATADRMFPAFMELAGLNADEMRLMSYSEELIAELEAASDRVNHDVFSYWRDGNQLQVEFRCDVPRAADSDATGGPIFRTRIRDIRQNFTLGLEQQGSGFVSFLSSIVWLSHLRRTCGERLVVLLDQPGGSLHTQTQLDLSRYITANRRSGDAILFTALEAFKMNSEDFSSVRTVEGARVREEIRFEKHIADVTAVPVIERFREEPRQPIRRGVAPSRVQAAEATGVHAPVVTAPASPAAATVQSTTVSATTVSTTVSATTVAMAPAAIAPVIAAPPVVVAPAALPETIPNREVNFSSGSLDTLLPPLTADSLALPESQPAEATQESWWNELSFLKRRDS